ncbi:spore coat U domain-containing protein [Alcanivorax sp.]|jgi:spore coat protein U-like protein|uniref:Csu type fimbrial protein n=1 Tax=Alcanivorax sp. TaxID=1872427 RepID=UPI0032D98515
MMKTGNLLLTGVALCLAVPAWSDVICSLQGSPTLDFGNVDPFTGGNVLTQVTVNWSCTRGFFESTQNTMCVHLGNDNNGGMLPRRMVANSNQPPLIPFNVYTTAARVEVVGQPGGATNVGIPINVNMPFFGNRTDSGTVTLYGLLPGPLPGTTRAEFHQALMTNSQVRVREGGFNQSCSAGAGAITDNYTLTAQVNIPDQCQVSATDLDFGTRNTPLAQVDSTSTVTVRCTNTTDFDVGLNGGLNGNRQMSNGTDQVDYELYQDAGRSVLWGNMPGTLQSGIGLGTGSAQNLTVYGRVFPDPSAEAGSYSDTVTVEVTF